MGLDAELRFTTLAELTDNEIEELGYNLYSAFGQAINRGPSDIWGNLRGVSRYKEYGDKEVTPLMYEVNVTGRYWGPGYERGNIVELIAIASFIELSVPNSHILYGHDCDDNYIVFDAAKRNEYFEHFVKVQRRPYHDGFGKDEPVICDFCNKPAAGYMWSGAETGWKCHGCPQYFRKYADGRVVKADNRYNPLSTK